MLAAANDAPVVASDADPRGSVDVELAPTQRIIAVGKNRSGKSTWFRQPDVCGALERAIVLDTKGEPPWVGFARSLGYEIRNGERAAIAALRDRDPPPRILVRCFDPLGDAGAELCEEIMRRPAQVGTAIVDECVHWCRGHEVCRGLRLIWTMAGMGLGGFAGTQRPVDIWNGFLSESDHRVIFRLELRSDRDKLEEFIPGVVEQAATLDKFWWLYHDAGQLGPAVLMRPVG